MMRPPVQDWPSAAVLVLAVGLLTALLAVALLEAPDQAAVLVLVGSGWVALAWLGARLARSPPRDAAP